MPSTTQLQPVETSQAPQPSTNPYLSTLRSNTALPSISQYKPIVSTPKPPEFTTQPVPTNKASTAYCSSVFYTHSHSAKPELLSGTPTSTAKSEHTTVFQTASEPVYTSSVKPINPQTIAGMSYYTSESHEHTTMLQTASDPVYTLSASPKPTNPPGM